MGKTRYLTEKQVREKITRLCDESGGVSGLARKLKCSESYVKNTVGGHCRPGPDFLKAVGARKEVVVRYVEVAGGPP